MKARIFGAIFGALFVSNLVLAGAPELVGNWAGTGQSILPDGTLVESDAKACIYAQYGGLFAGIFVAVNYEAGTENIDSCQYARATGYISVNKRITATLTPDPIMIGWPEGMPLPMALFEGKWEGKRIKGIFRDPSDGATAHTQLSPDNSMNYCDPANIEAFLAVCSP